MIGKLSGRLEYRASDHVLIDVRGVGYLVFCSCSHAADLAKFRTASSRGIGRAGRSAQIVHTGFAGPDHPLLAGQPAPDDTIPTEREPEFGDVRVIRPTRKRRAW